LCKKQLENEILGTAAGQKTLDAMITKSTDVLLKRKNRKRLILDVDSTEDPAQGNQQYIAYNGHFGKNCVHPLFCFTSDGDGLAAKLRLGNVHSATGTLNLIKPIVARYWHVHFASAFALRHHYRGVLGWRH